VVLAGSGKRRAIGRYPTVTLAEARKLARFYVPEEYSNHSFEDALTLFLENSSKHRHRPSHATETKRVLEKHFKPHFGSRKLDTITAREISAIIDTMHRTPSAAQHAFKALRTFFNFRFKREFINVSPMARLDMPKANGSRERVLSEQELKTVLLGAQKYGFPYGTIITLLAITGARRAEIANLRRSWIKGDFIVFPSSITKNGREHRLPIGHFTKLILEAIPKGGDIYFLTRDRDTPFCGWDGSKEHFDKLYPVEHWTLHDLRRTAATNWAAQGAPIHVVEKLLNHTSGTICGVAATTVSLMRKKMRETIELWETYLEATLTEPLKIAA